MEYGDFFDREAAKEKAELNLIRREYSKLVKKIKNLNEGILGTVIKELKAEDENRDFSFIPLIANDRIKTSSHFSKAELKEMIDLMKLVLEEVSQRDETGDNEVYAKWAIPVTTKSGRVPPAPTADEYANVRGAGRIYPGNWGKYPNDEDLW